MSEQPSRSPPPKPRSLQGDLRRLPAALANLVEQPRWVVWRWELDARRTRWTKVPYQPASTHRHAKANDPSTWSAHGAAVDVVDQGYADGIGYQLKDGEVGAFDLDDCRDPENGKIASWAWTLIDAARSYTEVTVSGTGIRIIGTAQGDLVHRKFGQGADGSLEIYRRCARFIVVTGLPVSGAYGELCDIDQAIDDTLNGVDGKGRPEAGPTLDLASLPFSQNVDSKAAALPEPLLNIIIAGVPEGQRSEQFHHAVGWLKDRGWIADQIIALLERYPSGIAAKYQGRLRAEVERCFIKTGQSSDREEVSSERSPSGPKPLPLHWHGDPDDTAERKWLVSEMIPETGKGLLSGQWGTAKTFVAMDLSGSLMTGADFAGRAVLRRGGVVFIAAEGANEVSIRLRGVVDHKLADQANIDPAKLERLPFAWIDECPPLTRADALGILQVTIAAAAERMQAEFDLPVGLIVVDTLMAAADFEDENNSAQGQKVMRVLEALSRTSGAFALAVDHFGKAVETGTRGTSAKEGAADLVLALLGEKDIAGKVTNRRMALRKLRGGATGSVTPFELRKVTFDLGEQLRATTTCIVDWQAEGGVVPTKKPLSDGGKHFMQSLREALLEHGSKRTPLGSTGPTVLTVEADHVRDEFVASYAADAEDNEQRANTKRAAYRRGLKAAKEAGLFCSREIASTEYYWLTASDDL